MKEINLSVIVPVYNEAASIEAVILGLQNQLKQIDLLAAYEIIVVNDGSIDATRNILDKLVKIKIIDHQHNRGYGAALKSGIKNSVYDWILIMDADGTYPLSALGALLDKTNESDLIIGSRGEKNNAIPWKRKYAKIFLNKFASYLSGQNIPDLNSGLRIFKKEIILQYWDLFPNKFSFTSTLTMVCLTHNYNVAFVPIDYYKRHGKSSLKSLDFFNFLKLVTKLSLFFNPFKVFAPISLFLLLVAGFLVVSFWSGLTAKFMDVTFIVLCATALQTFFFGLLAEIIIHNE